MILKIGDSVSVLDEDLSGVIKTLDDHAVTIETKDGFLLNFDKSELILNQNSIIDHAVDSSQIHEVIAEKETRKRKPSVKVKPKERAQATMEVDLHIHHLVTSSRGMTNFEILNLQMQTAKRQLEFAIKKRIQRVVFIHGVGEGVLKEELKTLFRRYDNLKYYDANYQKYGLGATEVYIFQNS